MTLRQRAGVRTSLSQICTVVRVVSVVVVAVVVVGLVEQSVHLSYGLASPLRCGNSGQRSVSGTSGERERERERGREREREREK